MEKKTKKNTHAKKHLRESITLQLHTALVNFKEMLHEKKLQKLVKKAAKLLADGLHHNKPAAPAVSKKTPAKKSAPPKPAPKKTISKKAAPKKAAKKK